mmetsp:Transcript_126563/g.219312  ORF Transcript_126563/g.219312 Transcript_126563/m.219312 type:complete len:228 (+) Transcript_126563:974-1657(+)
MIPAMNPDRAAAQGSRVEHPAVIPTRPARTPFIMESASQNFLKMRARIKAAHPPAAAAMVVVTQTLAETAWNPPDKASVEPALKPYQPSHRIRVPIATSVWLWGAKALSRAAWSSGDSSLGPKRSFLGPKIAAPTKAATPPVKWTTPEPAKSIKPLVPDMQASNVFLKTMLIEFFDRQVPHSNMVKPVCMKKTNMAQTINQALLMAPSVALSATVAAAASVAAAATC